jgi:hypothetical protein
LKCTNCNKNIISVHNEYSNFPIYCVNCWWSDDWDAIDYGREFNFGKSFFEQWELLQNDVPKINMINDN